MDWVYLAQDREDLGTVIKSGNFFRRFETQTASCRYFVGSSVACLITYLVR
jgi:hypothetical protein